MEVEIYERAENIENMHNPRLIYRTNDPYNKYSSIEEAICEGRKNSKKKCCKTACNRLRMIKDYLTCFENNDVLMEEFKKMEKIIEDGFNFIS